MHCPLEMIELRVERCPIKACIYRKQDGGCAHTKLADEDGVVANTIADARQFKAYKVKAHAASGRDYIEAGLVIDRYAEYVRDSFPCTTSNANSVNATYEGETSISRVLRLVFKLTHQQQQKFWEPVRYDEWQRQNTVKFTMNDLSQALKYVSFQFAA